MSCCFRCLNMFFTAAKDCDTLSKLLESAPLKKGFHAFYCHGSIIGDLYAQRIDQQDLTVNFLKKSFEEFGGIINPNTPNENSDFTANELSLVGYKTKPTLEFPEKVALKFAGKLRATLGLGQPYGNAPGYALYQASIYNLLSASYEQSPIYDTGGLYREYLLWNDNGLWTQEEWTARAKELQTNLPTAQADTPNEPVAASPEMPQLHSAEPWKRLAAFVKDSVSTLFSGKTHVILETSNEPVSTQQPIATQTETSVEPQQAEPSNSTAEQAKLSPEQANLRLAWLGSGWLSSRLEGALAQSPSDYATDLYPYPPEIEVWAKAALERLMAYDTALLSYYRKEQKTDLPGWQDWQNYIATLCEFLPYHKPRNNPNAKKEDYLPTNSSGSRGGPRLWQGYLGPQVNMHIRHLLLDGWLTLWPVKGKLYYQPGSLALLYWAARLADKPYTNSPKEFIDNYDWQSKSKYWFGGNWLGQQHDGQ